MLGRFEVALGTQGFFLSQHVGIGNAKLSRWGSRPMQDQCETPKRAILRYNEI